MVKAAETCEAARAELIDTWDAQLRADPDKTRISLTHTNAEVRDLNQAARDRLRDAGELGQDVRISAERGARDFASGDRIMFLKNERGMGVKNGRSEEHTSELQSLMRTSYAVFFLTKKKKPCKLPTPTNYNPDTH